MKLLDFVAFFVKIKQKQVFLFFSYLIWIQKFNFALFFKIVKIRDERRYKISIFGASKPTI